MYSPIQGMLQPYELGPGPHLFTDWRYVRPGQVRWEGSSGQDVSLFATEGAPDAVRAMPLDTPLGIRLVAQPAQRIGPLIRPNYPWEHTVFWPTILHVDGKYRMWYESVPDRYWQAKAPDPGATRSPGWGDLLCYAESDDLEHWTKPKLGILDYDGEPSNIVFGGPLTPVTGLHGAAVLHDPSASSAERYKLIYMGKVPAEQQTASGGSVELKDPVANYYQSAMYGAVSPDGLHWTALPDPIMLVNSDTGNTAYYDTTTGKYVAFVRMWFYGRRGIGRSETDDFARWPLPEPILWPGPENPAEVDLYTNAHTLYPGTTDHHLIFPAWYRRATDTTEVHIASSQEGRLWSRIPGEPVLATADDGAWDGGCLFIGKSLVPYGSDRVAAPYVGYSVPHKYPRSMVLGDIGLAVWPAERLVALQADEIGQFTTPPLIFQGRELQLNLLTARAGHVRVEVAAAEDPIRPVPTKAGAAFEGFSLAESDPLWGDRQRATVTWKSQNDLSAFAGKPVVLRFTLSGAKLFAFSFV
ncbi:MAG: hypothetical protein JNL42_06360 [Anaerolineae bacterium]|nr:hypothetical protein [Anaerolineae bacterium]